jgi:hypothetical protein
MKEKHGKMDAFLQQSCKKASIFPNINPFPAGDFLNTAPSFIGKGVGDGVRFCLRKCPGRQGVLIRGLDPTRVSAYFLEI